MSKIIDISKWTAQINKGYLELCVMLTLNVHGSCYGAQLLEHLNTHGLNVPEGTLYPLLNRMHKNEWLSSYWETPTAGGHPRRFYQLKKEHLPTMRKMIKTYKNYCHILITLENSHEQK